MPRVRAMSRARRGSAGVWRRMATMVGQRLGGRRVVEGGLAGSGWGVEARRWRRLAVVVRRGCRRRVVAGAGCCVGGAGWVTVMSIAAMVVLVSGRVSVWRFQVWYREMPHLTVRTL